MRWSLLLLLLVSCGDSPRATSPCEVLKEQIHTKILARGVKLFSLTVIDSDQPHIGRVVGVCEGGTKKIIYRREYR